MIDLLAALMIQSVAPPRADLAGTGPDMLGYHSIQADCWTITHLNGRNGVWGSWAALLSEASVTFAEDEAGKPTVLIRCREGWACIEEGGERTVARHVTHAIPFGDAAAARAYIERLNDVMPACERETAE